MKNPSSTNDTRGKHPYLIPHNWLPGGKFCYWDRLRNYNPDFCERMDEWAERMQNKRPMENLIINRKGRL